MAIVGTQHFFHDPPLRVRREWIHHHHSLDRGPPLMPPRRHSSLQQLARTDADLLAKSMEPKEETEESGSPKH